MKQAAEKTGLAKHEVALASAHVALAGRFTAVPAREKKLTAAGRLCAFLCTSRPIKPLKVEGA